MFEDAERRENIIRVSMKDAAEYALDNSEEFASLMEGFLCSLNELSKEYLEGLNALFITYKDVAALLGATVVVGGAFTNDVWTKSSDDSMCIGGVVGAKPEEVIRRTKLYVKSLRDKEKRGEIS